MSEDKIYSSPIRNIEDFTFDQTVSEAFDDMIDRSVPGYRTLIANMGPIASHFLRAGTNCYDLGCSHGAAALSVYHHCHDLAVNIYAIDNSAAMTRRCETLIKHARANKKIMVRQNDICDVSINNASVVILNLTLQFLPIQKRQALLENIYRGLVSGGVCILTEKIIFKDAWHEDLYQQLHTRFKSANKYSQLEISQKRKALENVLIRESLQTHQQRLTEIGFSHSLVWFQCINFVSILAIK